MHEGLDGDGVEGSAVAGRVHVPLQIGVHVLEDEHELALGVDDIVEGEDVGVLQLLHQGDLADGCGGCAFFRIEVDLLEGNELAGLAVTPFEDLRMLAEARGATRGGVEAHTVA